MAMLFVRCKGGISHNPAEFATPADMQLGAHVLFDFLQNLGNKP
jgi:allantoate deiminase